MWKTKSRKILMGVLIVLSILMISGSSFATSDSSELFSDDFAGGIILGGLVMISALIVFGFFIAGIVLLITSIVMLVRVNKSNKSFDLDKSVITAKNKILVFIILFILVLGFNVLELFEEFNVSILAFIIVCLFTLLLLISSYESYKTNVLRAVQTENGVATFLLFFVLISIIAKSGVIIALDSANMLLDNILNASNLFIISMALLLFVDVAKILKSMNKEEKQQNGMSKNMMVAIAGAIIIILNSVATGVVLADEIKNPKDLDEIIKELEEIINKDYSDENPVTSVVNNVLDEFIFGDDEFFNKAENAVKEYESTYDEQQQAIQDLINAMNNQIESEDLMNVLEN